MTDDVWVYVSGTGDATLHPTRHDAEEAGRDDPDAWIEHTRLWEPTQAPSGDETRHLDRRAELDARNRSAGRTWIAPPVLSIQGTAFYNPWIEDNA